MSKSSDRHEVTPRDRVDEILPVVLPPRCPTIYASSSVFSRCSRTHTLVLHDAHAHLPVLPLIDVELGEGASAVVAGARTALTRALRFGRGGTTEFWRVLVAFAEVGDAVVSTVASARAPDEATDGLARVGKGKREGTRTRVGGGGEVHVG